MKYVIGFLMSVGLLCAGYVLAGYVQDEAWAPKISSAGHNSVYRFEWYADVCYVVQGGNGAVGISCVKK